MSHRLLAASIGLAILAAPIPGGAVPGCPANVLSVDNVDSWSTEAIRDTSVYTGNTSESAGFNLPGVSIHASASSWSPETGASASAYAQDDLVLTGLPDGTVVQIKVVYALNGSYQPSRAWRGMALWVNSIRVPFTYGDATYEQGELVFPVTVGQPFRLQVQASASAPHNSEAWVRGGWWFHQLPAGTRITSCQGFQMDSPVPITPGTWGALKRRYR